MIELNTDADGIATLTIDMPGRGMNVIDWALVQTLSERIDQLAADDTVRGVVLTSGKASFVAGADLAIMKDFVQPGVTPRQAADLIGGIGQVLRKLETLGKPVVGASTGTALGGGLELLLACHHRVAADVKGAVYGLPEVKLGLLPGAGGTQRLPRLIGIAKALPLMVEGQPVGTQAALELGLLHEVVPPEQLLAAARQALRDGRVNPTAPWDRKGFKLPGGDSGQPALADVFATTNGRIQGRTHGLLPAPKAIVGCVYDGSRLPIDRALRTEQMYFAQLVQGAVAQGLIRSQFFTRQAADKLVRRPQDIPAEKIGTVGVLGTSEVALMWAQLAAAAGLNVVLHEADAAALRHALLQLGASLTAPEGHWRLSAEQAVQALSRIDGVSALSRLNQAEVVLAGGALSAGLLAELSQAMRTDAVLVRAAEAGAMAAPVASWAQGFARPERVLGVVPTAPLAQAGLCGLWELMVPSTCTPTAVARVMDLARQLRRTPILVGDAAGALVGRCLQACVAEGARLVAEGQLPVAVDNAAVSAGLPLGPLALARRWGQAEVMPLAAAALTAQPAMAVRSTHQGAGGATRAAPALTQAEMAERLLAALTLSALNAVAEGVITDAAEGDLLMVQAGAYPLHLGGPFYAVHTEGFDAFVARMHLLSARWGERFTPPGAAPLPLTHHNHHIHR